MAISIDWGTKVIFVPKDDMALVQTVPFEIRSLDINEFRLALRELEYSEDGMLYEPTHNHNTPVSIGGTSLARVIEIINGYTIVFENGSYVAQVINGNSNIGDVVNLNTVSVRTSNSAGLIVSEGASTDWSTIEKAQIRQRLGLDGSKSIPTSKPEFATPLDVENSAFL